MQVKEDTHAGQREGPWRRERASETVSASLTRSVHHPVARFVPVILIEPQRHTRRDTHTLIHSEWHTERESECERARELRTAKRHTRLASGAHLRRAYIPDATPTASDLGEEGTGSQWRLALKSVLPLATALLALPRLSKVRLLCHGSHSCLTVCLFVSVYVALQRCISLSLRLLCPSLSFAFPPAFSLAPLVRSYPAVFCVGSHVSVSHLSLTFAPLCICLTSVSHFASLCICLTHIVLVLAVSLSFSRSHTQDGSPSLFPAVWFAVL